MSWLSNLFARSRPAEDLDPVAALPPPEPPDWALELLEAVQKSARAQAKGAVRLEALEAKLEGGFADLRAALRDRPASPAASSPSPSPDPVLDALDLLDEAARALSASGSEAVVQGLRGVTARLERFLAEGGVTRLSQASSPLDGRTFRVVGTVQRPDLAEGEPALVVRAAARRGDRLVREGEVLVNRRENEGVL